MNDLELLTRMRAGVPLAPPSPAAEAALATEIASAARPDLRPRRPRPIHPARRPLRIRATRRRLAACSIAAAAVVAVAGTLVAVHRGGPSGPEVVSWSGRPGSPVPSGLSVGVARTGIQLVDLATRAAALTPGRPPGPGQWIYLKIETANSTAGSGGFLFGPPNERQIGLQWIQAGWRHWAAAGPFPVNLPAQTVVHGKLSISPGGPGFDLGGWKSVTAAYLGSLPVNPAALRAVILADNDPRMPWYAADPNVAVFNAISTVLMGELQGVWIPPRLAAAMYGVLRQTPGVRFDRAVDLAGRTGLGFYMIIGGWYKQELVISRATYTYMGDETVAERAHADVGTDGTRHIVKGQVLGWEALLGSAVVSRAGQIP